jgi:hypothetical protein
MKYLAVATNRKDVGQRNGWESTAMTDTTHDARR